MLTATRREWNELYVFFALLGKGSVTLGDEEGKPSSRVLPIVRISRQEHDGKREYQVEKDEVHVTGGQMEIKLTGRLKAAMETFDISLVDHVVMCDDRFYSFSDERMTIKTDSGPRPE